jgi:hypothetical protein
VEADWFNTTGESTMSRIQVRMVAIALTGLFMMALTVRGAEPRTNQ